MVGRDSAAVLQKQCKTALNFPAEGETTRRALPAVGTPVTAVAAGGRGDGGGSGGGGGGGGCGRVDRSKKDLEPCVGGEIYYRGVRPVNGRRDEFSCRIRVNGEIVDLGTFGTTKAAALVWCDVAHALRLRFAPRRCVPLARLLVS